MATLRTVYVDETLRIVLDRNVGVAVWSNAPSVEQLQQLHAVLQTLRREAKEGAAFMNVVTGGVPRFSNEVREEAARIAGDAGDRDVGTAHVVLAGGLVGTTVRAFISTMTLIGRPKVPTKTFGDVSSAARWLASLIEVSKGPQWTPEDLVALAEQAIQAER